jgi:hypothetical protein
MIQSIAGAAGVDVVNGWCENISLPYSSHPQLGFVRVANTGFEFFNGGGWQSLPSKYVTIKLAVQSELALAWANKKMLEENAWQLAALKSNAVRIALDNLTTAAQELTLLAALTNDYE